MNRHIEIIDMSCVLYELHFNFREITKNHIKDIVINVLTIKIDSHLNQITNLVFNYTLDPELTIAELKNRYERAYDKERVNDVIEMAYQLTPYTYVVEPPHPNCTPRYEIKNDYFIVVVQ